MRDVDKRTQSATTTSVIILLKLKKAGERR